MDISELLNDLNEKQRNAVVAPLGNYLVLAGAGSGKTRVLTYRIAWLSAVEKIPESSIMAVTFTNKAATEMRHRIEATLARYSHQRLFGMWIGTFHSIANRLLRSHYADAGLPQDFQILDSEDQLRLVKRLMKLHQYDEKAFPYKQACWYINNKKEEGLRPHQIEDNNDRQEREWIKIYKIYQDACDRSGLVDFAELLLRAYELWLKNPHILQYYQQRFQHVLIDEFQDTNKIQYAWIKLLAGLLGSGQVQNWLDNGGKVDDCAVLYRSNSQSRVIEEAFLRAKIPYRIYGGMRFFERQEIKDALAYLRLIANRQDDAAFERVVNTPPRGIGERTLDILRNLTRERQVTLWQATQLAIQENLIPIRSVTVLLRFIELINSLQQETAEMPLFVQTDFVIKHSGLYDMYKQEKGDKGEVRIENLEELVTATREFIKPDEAEDMSDLVAFLTHTSLEAGEEQAASHQPCVQMMTLHSAKGLEFPRVFIVGMEEGLFPSFRSGEDLARLEEERRLAYVGITRAKQKLTLCYAEVRRLYGKDEKHIPSRFIAELPQECIQEVRLRGTVTRAYNRSAVGSIVKTDLSDNSWKVGQKVKHEKFGQGTVINVEGADNNTRLQIAFQGQGIKWLVAHLAKLEKI
ncbi:UvrD-helicase domain-containing protein [Histophilus somni]|uniref:UvrD-helicase domain-containing protein n=1 Tax=Histophilus somni TaxID=731 RepID=UPI00094B6CCE|nr:UvrD-helicase domain-containing protein [Histophilus somni]